MPGLPTNPMGHLTCDVIGRRRNPHWGGAGGDFHWRSGSVTATVPSPLTPPTPTPSPATVITLIPLNLIQLNHTK